MSDVRMVDEDTQARRLESLGRLAAGVAHDFNNLVTIVLGYADLLATHLPEDGPGRDLLEGLNGAASQASRLAGQLLGLARQRPLPPQVFDLSGLVQELGDLLRRVFDARIEFRVETTAGLRVRGVVSELTQVFLNLCLNARDAMPRGGRLTVRTEIAVFSEADPGRKPGRYIQLRIADTGVGISTDALPHIFEPFFTTRPGLGTGIGLSTVRRIVEEHEGWIECESELDRGSCFDVFLPID